MEETTEKEDARKIVVYRPEADVIRKMYVFCDFSKLWIFLSSFIYSNHHHV